MNKITSFLVILLINLLTGLIIYNKLESPDFYKALVPIVLSTISVSIAILSKRKEKLLFYVKLNNVSDVLKVELKVFNDSNKYFNINCLKIAYYPEIIINQPLDPNEKLLIEKEIISIDKSEIHTNFKIKTTLHCLDLTINKRRKYVFKTYNPFTDKIPLLRKFILNIKRWLNIIKG